MTTQIRYVEHRDFRENIQRLTKAGGPYQKAADLIKVLFANIHLGERNPFQHLKTTNHGETRLSKCVKYDLSGACRLITIQDNNIVFLLFAGNHNDADKWLDRHKDIQFSVDKNGTVELVPQSASLANAITFENANSWHLEKLYKLINPSTLFDRILENVSRSISRKLEEITGAHSEEEILSIAKEINEANISEALYDTFVLLKADKIKDAHNRLKLALGDVSNLENLSTPEIKTVKFGDSLIEFRPDDIEFLARADQIMKGGNYKSWMLFMHPEQEKIATANLNGPAKLVGVSGSGKTCVVVRRAIWLAFQNPNEKILVLTLNRPLSTLTHDLIKASAPAELLQNIEVLPFFKICQNLLATFEPENIKIHDDRAWKSGEHIDEVWTEFYRCEVNNSDASVLLPLHFSLISRGINSEHYIREEFDWIRSSFPKSRREEYLKIEREGRVIPFDADARSRILKALDFWETKMKAIGVCDYLGLATELYKHKEKIKSEYRSIIVDECQDFGTIELEIIRSLTPKNTNDIFLCGDPAQRVHTKRQSIKAAGIDTHASRSMALNKNYRNTRDILQAAFHILNQNLHLEHLSLEDFEFLDPELADRSGNTPLILKAPSLEQEFRYTLNYIEQAINENPGTKGCISYCGYSNYEIETLAKQIKIPVLDGSVNIDENDIFLSDLEQTKGFEFDYMAILNCTQHALPDPAAPKEEQFRDISKFYVAMTRTKQQLILSFHDTKSDLLANSESHFLEDDWASWLETCAKDCELAPLRLESSRGEGTDRSTNLSGLRFIYHSDAIGLSTRAIDAITRLVDGVGLRDNRGPKKWKTVETMLFDMKKLPWLRNKIGAATYDEIINSKFARTLLTPPKNIPKNPMLSFTKQEA